MEPFIGQIIMFGGNFAPRSWAFCDGQLLAISQNTALFSILGTTYGGDGRTTFALPDLRGRAAISEGTGPGLPTYRLGQRGGQSTHTLTTLEMPVHNHTAAVSDGSVKLSTTAGTRDTPIAGDVPASASFGSGLGSTKVKSFGPNADTVDGQALSAPTIGNAGGSQGHNNMPPYLAVNYIIALYGTFPSRN
ncbi:phage tail protein [Polaribacter sp.]|uniref:phage tail protein n=1 Tax=Polaribacter sp. TaxID=1920175 RepID=UPI003EF95868